MEHLSLRMPLSCGAVRAFVSMTRMSFPKNAQRSAS